ncbi:hypothetical protein ACHWQZ_G007942 [Mnemiopsis leidyi]
MANQEDTETSRKARLVECDNCGAKIKEYNGGLDLAKHKSRTTCRKENCGVCGQNVPFLEKIQHNASHKTSASTSFSLRPSSHTPLVMPDFVVDYDYSSIYTKFAKNIEPKIVKRRISTIYRFQLAKLCCDEIIDSITKIFHAQTTSFKLSISFSYILLNQETQELEFYYASQNNQKLFDVPYFVGNLLDLSNLTKKIQTIDLKSHVTYPNSRFVFRKATNVEFYVTHLHNTPIGTAISLPSYLKNNKGLISLQNSRKTGQPFNDNLCFFRCVALHRGAEVTNLERSTKGLFQEFCEKYALTPSEFCGVTLGQLESLSQMFGIGICVYKLYEAGNCELVYRSLKQDGIMSLNLFGNHFSFIKNFGQYSSSYLCLRCKKSFNRKFNMQCHTRTCDASTKKIYGRGVFSPTLTIFDKLALHGIYIPKELQFYEHKIVFDIECLLIRDTGLSNTDSVTYTFRHELASISVCSNITDYEDPVCFISDGCPKKLLKTCLDYMTEIAVVAKLEQRQKFADYIEQIEEMNDTNLVEKFDEYLSQVPCLSFNGSKYDLRVCKSILISLLVQMEEVKFVIKRGGSYVCIATENLKFLDIISYLAAGTSLDGFLKAYNASVRKSFFPYEYFSTLDLLESCQFPPYNGFYSSLKQCNTLEPGKTSTLTDDEKAAIGRTPNKEFPLTDNESQEIGLFRYNTLRDNFNNNEWTMRNYLEFYNNNDVVPFLEAVENMCTYYKTRGVDIFKEAVSVPGVSLRLAFREMDQQQSFYLFNKRHSDLVDLFLSNNVGGPAIIFDRWQEVGKTTIRHNPRGKPTKTILGLDGVALYLWCTSQDMPCGFYVRRRSEKNFIKEYPTPISSVATEWLADLEHRQNTTIQHARNKGEFRLGSKQIPVDGFRMSDKTVFQFYGCWWHGCPKCKTDDRDVSTGGKTLNDKLKHTEKVEEYIKDCGYRLVTIWECEWKEYKRSHNIHNRYTYPTESVYRMSESSLLERIRQGLIFGAVEVDLHVPDSLKEYFSEMPPIFKNTVVKHEDIGVFMQDFLKERNREFRDTRYLIGSMFGDKILIITPLLLWYIDHGLVVTRIHQLIEFKPSKCFKTFADRVSNDRRAGDRDPSMKAIADTSKLIGNSFYGYTIMNKGKHQNVQFLNETDAIRVINNPRFVSLEEFEDSYEVTSKKRVIKYDLPVQIGFFVYQYAKLRMLNFYFDVVDRFVSREDYNMLEMDTDSLYMALSGTSLEEIVKPELRSEWERQKTIWFPSEENYAHDLREPGLFKVEWQGKGFVGLSAKTYFCFSDDPKHDKLSTKGVNKSAGITRSDFLRVKETKETVCAFNRGFLVKNNQTFSYEMERKGLSFFYCKRKVLDDGISTTYLDI